MLLDVETRFRPESGYSAVAVAGEVDLMTAAEFVQALTRAAFPDARASSADGVQADPPVPHSVIVDLSGVRFFAARGVRSVEELADRLTPPATLVLVCPPSSPVRRLLQLSGLATRWPVHDDLDAAIVAATDRMRAWRTGSGPGHPAVERPRDGGCRDEGAGRRPGSGYPSTS